jgi:hypothetical protein
MDSGVDEKALSWEHVTDAGAMERHLLDYNREHFCKAASILRQSGTFFLHYQSRRNTSRRSRLEALKHF